MGFFGKFKAEKAPESKPAVDYSSLYDEEENEDDDDESISVYDAALIWASNGKDEDYMFGYTEEELEDAL